MIKTRTVSGRKSWIATTPRDESMEFTRRKDAVDWLMRHTCSMFVEHPTWYGDFCATCGGHQSMHPEA